MPIEIERALGIPADAVPYLHNDCGKVAFWRHGINPDAVSSEAWLPSGEHPEPHSPIVCGSCGADIASVSSLTKIGE